MEEKYNILFAALIIAFISVSILCVYADDSNSSNSTNNSTNSTNVTKKVTKGAIVQPMSTSSTSIQVTPQEVNMGPWNADGTQHIISNAATVKVHAEAGWFSRKDGYLYVRASGNFVSSTNPSSTISLGNFQYRCPGYVDTMTTFSTTDYPIYHYYPDIYFPLLGLYGSDYTFNMNYYLTIPVGTEPGIYSTTIIYTAT